ncbi:DUF933 domain-containing protein [Verrucomicrobiota bacterium]
MKIAFAGIDLPEGKMKYADPVFLALVDQFKPAKASPYFFEFLPNDYESAACVAVTGDRILDLLILDIEKLEGRLERGGDPAERSVVEKCLAHLERELPLCDMETAEEEKVIMRGLGLVSLKPVLVVESSVVDVTEFCGKMMDKAGVMFFYTVGKKEVHAWFVDKGVDAVTCAEKIHSDLARGFIKAEIISFDELKNFHSMQDARAKGVTRLVDRDYVIESNTIIDIRFNV